MSTNDKDGTIDSGLDIKGALTNIKLDVAETDSRSPYMKADLVRACRVNDSTAVSFYQLDYQAIVNSMAVADKSGAGEPAMTSAILVGKIVFDDAGFDQCVAELNRLRDKIRAKQT